MQEESGETESRDLSLPRVDLAADFARRVGDSMHIGLQHIACCDGARECRISRRRTGALLYAWRKIPHVRAQEDDNRAIRPGVPEMNVRLGDRSR